MPPESKISFDDFKKVDVTVGKILSAEKVPETDKLLRLQVDFGHNTSDEQDTRPTERFQSSGPAKVRMEDTSPNLPSEERRKPGRDVRQIISGIAEYFSDPQALVGKKCMFVTNLAPRIIKGLESNGMLFAVSTEDGKFSLLEPNPNIPEGTKAQ